jgi:hypothetical protein
MVMSRVGLMKGMRAVDVGTGVVHGPAARKDRVGMVVRLLHWSVRGFLIQINFNNWLSMLICANN